MSIKFKYSENYMSLKEINSIIKTYRSNNIGIQFQIFLLRNVFLLLQLIYY